MNIHESKAKAMPGTETNPPEPRLVMLMIVTPPDLPIAKYSLRAVMRLLSPEVNLVVFCNGLSADQELLVANWVKTPHATIRSNRSRIDLARLASEVGGFFSLGENRTDFREGLYESCGEVWSRELVGFDSELVGMLDADCEIWSAEILKECLAVFEANSRIFVVSSSHSDEKLIHDSYSDSPALLAARYHTWLCVYRRAALLEMSDFTYREEMSESYVRKFDHSAFLQKELLSKGWQGALLTTATRASYIHYGAFAKNKSLRGKSLAAYRLVRVGRHNGYSHRIKGKILPTAIQIVASACYRALRLARFDRERLVYNF